MSRLSPVQRAFLDGICHGYRRAKAELRREVDATIDQLNVATAEVRAETRAIRSEFARLQAIESAANAERDESTLLNSFDNTKRAVDVFHAAEKSYVVVRLQRRSPGWLSILKVDDSYDRAGPLKSCLSASLGPTSLHEVVRDIENHSWRTKYRGPFLVHASQACFAQT